METIITNDPKNDMDIEIIIGKFKTDEAFNRRTRDGFVANAQPQGSAPYMLHLSSCFTLSNPKNRNHTGPSVDKYWSDDLDLMRRAWPYATECPKCFGGK
jgi:hypothetical protein